MLSAVTLLCAGLQYPCGAILSGGTIFRLSGTDLTRDAAQAFGRRSRPDYAADYILSLLYISIVLNYAVFCSATFAFSDLPLLCCGGGAVNPAGAFQDVFVARCRYLSHFGCRISLFSPLSAASAAKMKKNLAPLQVVRGKMKIIRTKGLEVCS
ncbi:hypothetical protein QE382_004749 [Sphingobacterium zeae]|uniref:Uncharacterized protein n=1 Tax=Sphingobacterium zeae TaxID=1776859 RepID=A0ABU0UD59_9SPHI|nr:hypothetical protein [Sphingobacterium zeae]